MNWGTLTAVVAKKIVVTEPIEEKTAAETASPPDEPITKAEPDTTEEPTEIPSPNTSKDTPGDTLESTPSEPTEDFADSGVPGQPENYQQIRARTLPTLLPSRHAQRAMKLPHRGSYLRSLSKWVRRRRRAVALLGMAAIVIIVGITAAHLFAKSSSNPLPQSLQQEVNFTLYYPHSRVGKYEYIAGSGAYTDGKLTYELGAGGPIIRISEQALSVQAPDLHQLPGFSVLQTPTGQAAIGASGNVLNGVVIAHKTLIILNGLGGVSRQDFTKTINNLGP